MGSMGLEEKGEVKDEKRRNTNTPNKDSRGQDRCGNTVEETEGKEDVSW